MFVRLCQLFCILNLALVRVKCTNLYVHPKTVYITGGKIAISCTDILDGHAPSIEWIKLNTLSIISSDPQARVRRDGHRLLFNSTDNSDEGLYCCKSAAENHGCTYNSTVRIVTARTVRAPAKNVISQSNSGHNIVTKSSTFGWRLEALPRTRCVLLGHGASINCLNNTYSFAENIQWFKMLSNGGLQLIPHSRGARVTSNAHQLQFKSTIAEDEGLYCCKTISEIECSPTAVANVTISLPPVLSTLQNRTVLLGETIAINCTVNITMGESITFLWQKNGKDLPNESRYSTITSNNGTTLIITNATAADQGNFNCIAKNRKYQQNNQSMYLHVQNPLGCSDINTSYSITVGLQSSIRNCTTTEKPEMYNVINKFLHSICNCSDYCLILDSINCSPDDTIITIVMTLKEKQPLFLRNLVYFTLQEGQVKVDLNFSIFCVVKTLCEKPSPPTTASPTILNITSSTTGEVTEESNGTILVVVIVISAVVMIILLILVLLIVVAILLRSHKCNKKAKQNSQTTPHMTNPVSIQVANGNTGGNDRPSTSSNNESGIGLSDCESPAIDSTDDPFFLNTIQYTNNCNTDLPNDSVRTDTSFPPVINPSSNIRQNVIKTNKKINSVSKHRRNMNIEWQDNKNYSRLNPYNSAPNPSSKLPATKPSVTEEVKVHLYEDVEGMNESTRRAAACPTHHHKTKHPQTRTPPNLSIMQHPPTSVYSSHNISPGNDVAINGNRAKLLPTTNYKHRSSSQV